MPKNPPKPYRLMAHTADIAIEVTGASYADVFENTLLAITDICVGGATVAARKRIIVVAEGGDRAELLVNFARGGLFLVNIHGFAVKHCKILSIGEKDIRASLDVVPLPKGSVFVREIKALTEHRSWLGIRRAGAPRAGG